MKHSIYVLKKLFDIKMVDIERGIYINSNKCGPFDCNLWLFINKFPKRFKKRSILDAKLLHKNSINNREYIKNGNLFIYTNRIFHKNNKLFKFKSDDYFYIYFDEKLYNISVGIRDANEPYAHLMLSYSKYYWSPIMMQMFSKYKDNVFPKIFYDKSYYDNKIYLEEKDDRDARTQTCSIDHIPMELRVKNINNHFTHKVEDIKSSINDCAINYHLFVPDDILQLICNFSIDKMYCEIWYTTRYVDNLVPDLHPINCIISNINNGDIIMSRNGSHHSWDNYYMFIQDKFSPSGKLFRVTKIKYLQKAMNRLIKQKIVEKNNWKPLKKFIDINNNTWIYHNINIY